LQKKIDLELAKICSEFCEQAYKGPEEFKKFLFTRVIMHTQLKFFDNDGAQAYGIVMPDQVVIIFRGTEPGELSDILADIKAWRSDSDTVGEVHAGFKGELDKISPEINKWIKQFEGTKLVITGHSLGAAMATLFTARLNKRGGDVVLYTYGSPRAGNIEWSRQFENIEAYRFVNTNDIVCTVPPFGFYTHVGELHYMSYKGTILTKTSWWQRMGDKIRGRLRAWQKRQLFSGIYDHMGSRYIKKIKQQ